MAKEWAKPFYNSALWKKQRLYILKRDNFRCTMPGCRRIATEVHHIVELTKDNINDPNICLNETNLRSLCHECHTMITQNAGVPNANILEQISWTPDGYPVSVKVNE
jgi:5-methylcytosine-specific restriction endonuclease McrA